MFLSRDAILGAEDLPHEDVSVPEWGGTVRVKTMSGSERDRYETDHLASPKADIRARLVCYTACDGDGRLLFGAADVALVGAKASPALDRLFNAAVRLNKIGKADVDELEKNS